MVKEWTRQKQQMEEELQQRRKQSEMEMQRYQDLQRQLGTEQQDIRKTHTELAESKEEVLRLQQRVEGLVGRLEATTAELRIERARAEDAGSVSAELRKALRKAEDEVEQLEDDLSQAQLQLKERKIAMEA